MVSQMLFGLGEQRLLQRHQAFIGAVAGGAHPEAEIGHHLVVARARGVQPSGGRADHFGQPRLDIEVNVFQLALEDEGAGGDLFFDRVQALPGSTWPSSLEMIPSVASMRQWARLPARSSPARRLSKSIEGVISLMMAAGPDSNRPPHILLVLIFSVQKAMTKKIIISLALIVGDRVQVLYGMALLSVHQRAGAASVPCRR